MRMSPKPLQRRVDPVLVGDVSALPSELDLFAQRFAPAVRREIRRLIRVSSRVADLATVFPGAVYALATGHGTAAERQHVLGLVEQGAPLKAVAKALGLPLWLRKLPPEAYTAPLPALPASEVFARRIANRMPASIEESAFWLAAVAFAARACHEDFAVWLAEQPIFEDRADPERMLAVLAAYGWYSGEPFTRSAAMIVVPWRPEIGLDTALCAAKSWFNRMRLVVQVSPGVIADPWLGEATLNGYRFTPLLCAADILEEAHAMQNCADQYADRLVRDRCRLFGIRRGAVRVATMEIGPHPRETGVLAINQLKARHNMPAPLDVWQAAHAWLARQPGLKRMSGVVAPERTPNAGLWRQLLAPYRQRKGGAPWLPEVLTPTTMTGLDGDLTDLARRCGVSSWLFT